MASIYSARLGSVVSAGPGTTDLFTAAAGTVTVLRDIAVFAQGASGNTALILYDGGPVVASWVDLSQYVSGHWSGRQVFEPGDVCQLQVLGGEFTAVVMGYLLTA